MKYDLIVYLIIISYYVCISLNLKKNMKNLTYDKNGNENYLYIIY
jgi:hypothetical protein